MNDHKLVPAVEVPPFDTEEQEAAWWDTHGTSEMRSEDDASPPATQPTSGRSGRVTITMRVSSHEAAQLEAQAREQGLGLEAYVRLILNRQALEPTRPRTDA